MAFTQGKKLPKALDDGVKETKAAKKRRVAAEKATENEQGQDRDGEERESTKMAAEELRGEIPTIRPGERMSDFSARVDAALPVSGLINKSIRGGKDPLGLKVGRTKTEKRMHRMYDEWRAEEARIQEKKQEALELAEEEEMDEEDGHVKWKVDIDPEQTGTKKKKGKGKGKKRKMLGEVEDGDEDPWAKLKRDRGEVKAGLNDVVQAPPTFSKVPKEKFKVSGARVEVDNVPKASGSLRRREELGEVRKSVVEGYRQMMKERSGT